MFISHELSHSDCLKLGSEGVDIGVGLERVLAAVNGSFDVFTVIGLDQVVNEFWPSLGLTRLSRTVLDHIRCVCFGISDGVEPSNTGAGYVLRKLIRRCISELKLSGFNLSSFLKLVSSVFECLCCANKFLLAKRGAVIASFELELGLFQKVLDINVSSLLKVGSLETFYSTYGISKLMLETLVPKAALCKFETPCYYDRDLVSTRILLFNNQVLVLSKTNIAAAAGGEIGGEGMLIGCDFDAHVRRERSSGCHHRVVGGRNLSSSLAAISKVYLLRNIYLETMIANAHTSLHAAFGLLKTFVVSASIKFSVVSYLGFVAELSGGNVFRTHLPFFQHLLSFRRCGVSTTTSYIKRNNSLRKLVKIILQSGFESEEECCGAHAAALDLGSFSFNVAFSSNIGLELSALSLLPVAYKLVSASKLLPPPPFQQPSWQQFRRCLDSKLFSCIVFVADKSDFNYEKLKMLSIQQSVFVCKSALSIGFADLSASSRLSAVFRKLRVAPNSL